MSKKNANPYNEKSNYGKLFAIWRKKQIITRSALVEAAKGMGMNDTAASATVTVLLSPREKDGRGDCRGNMSAKGHVYFADPLKKKVGEEKRFRLRYRKNALEPRVRVKQEVKAIKTPTKKAKKGSKAKAAA